MSLYILRWNPTFSMKYESHLEGMKMLQKSTIGTDWSIYDYENLKSGDIFIFNMVGCGEQDGIAAFGMFCSETTPGPNWRADDGTTRQYADLEMYCMIDRKKTDIFCAAEMEQSFPSIGWHSGHSGVPVPEETAEQLMLYIMQRTIYLQKPTSKISFTKSGLGYPLLPFFLDCINDCCPKFKNDIISRLVPPEYKNCIKYAEIMPIDSSDIVLTPGCTLEQIADIFTVELMLDDEEADKHSD